MGSARAQVMGTHRVHVVEDSEMEAKFSAPAGLAILEHTHLDAPFAIVTVGELAVDALHAGAHDDVRKHRIARLASAPRADIEGPIT